MKVSSYSSLVCEIRLYSKQLQQQSGKKKKILQIQGSIILFVFKNLATCCDSSTPVSGLPDQQHRSWKCCTEAVGLHYQTRQWCTEEEKKPWPT